MKFIPTEKQEKAFDKVAKAILEAKKCGLVFYGKSDNLVAYTKEADKYIYTMDFEEAGKYSQIPYISKYGLISDSGADDYPGFRTKEDEEKYS